MKRFCLFLLLVIGQWSLVLQDAHAATLSSGDLIKGPNDAVYYYGTNGKRYVFPNAKTYGTWYADFSSVKTVTAGELASIPIGGNATYRPGVRLVKITTDPKVYAVASNGTLRWVTTEAVASTLYGADWAKKIDDIADAFFINYTVGSSIVNASDFSPAAQTAAATDINTDKRLTGTPPIVAAPTVTPTSTTPTATTTTTAVTTPLSVSVSDSNPQAGDAILLTAIYSGIDAITKIELFFDGALATTCTSVSCTGEVLIPSSGTKEEYLIEARATKITTDVVTATTTVSTAPDGAALVTISLNQSVIKNNQDAGAIASVDASLVPLRIDISVNGVISAACTDGARTCGWSKILSGAEGTKIPIFARVTDSLGRFYTSETQYFTISSTDLPGVKVIPAKSSIFTGETVDVTVTASDSDGVASIDVIKDGTVIKHCTGAAPCTATTGLWSSVGELQFTGKAIDTIGSIGLSTDVGTVSVTTR